jgi:hypothetical protein
MEELPEKYGGAIEICAAVPADVSVVWVIVRLLRHEGRSDWMIASRSFAGISQVVDLEPSPAAEGLRWCEFRAVFVAPSDEKQSYLSVDPLFPKSVQRDIARIAPLNKMADLKCVFPTPLIPCAFQLRQIKEPASNGLVCADRRTCFRDPTARHDRRSERAT